MAVTFRSKNEAVTTGTSPTPTEPSGAASGDMLFAVYLTDTSGAPTLPSGWTSIYNGSSTHTAWRVGYVQRSGSSPGYAFTHTGTVYYEVHVMCLQGASTVTFDAQSTTGSVVASTSTPPNPTAVAPVQGTSLCLAGGFQFGAATAWTAPAGYTMRTRNTAGDDVMIASKSLATNASEDPAVFSGGTPSPDNMWNGFAVTFTDAAGGGGSTWGPLLGLANNRLVVPIEV